jgi:hypothetical protein
VAYEQDAAKLEALGEDIHSFLAMKKGKPIPVK